jgi:lipopolysaccharide/colanic/teichoic acid biosynthesis glycosyltransferase
MASAVAFQWFKISTPIPGFFSAHEASKIVQASLATIALTVVVLFSVTRLEEAPRSIPFIHLLLLSAGLLAQRFWTRYVRRVAGTRTHHWGGHTENVLVIGASRVAWFFSKMVEEFAPDDIRIIAILDERLYLQNRSLNGYAIVGPPAHLSTVIEEYATHGIDVHKVVLAMHPDDIDPVLWDAIRRTCEAKSIRTEWLYERFLMVPEHAQASLSPDEFGGVALEPVNGGYWRVKRGVDVVLAVIGIILAAPLLIGVAALVLIDVGPPVVFWQQRIGRFGRPLHVYKFRTMSASFNRQGECVPEAARLSALGQMLRRNRLDEIPQLFNILSGGMSFVGPRPLLPIDQPREANARLRVSPGLTGLAQVNGGKLLSPEEKDALDDWYVRNASLWLDLKILARTARVILCGDCRNDGAIAAALAARPTKLKANEASTATVLRPTSSVTGAETPTSIVRHWEMKNYT